MSTTDADARALLVQGQVVEVCYNMQTAVDDKHKLIVATHTINSNDRNAMSAIALEAKENLQAETLTALNDKGYHNGREIQQCKDNGIATICAPQEAVNSNEKGTTPEYLVTKFIYNEEADTYTCPAGNTLRTKGTWHHKQRTERSLGYQFKSIELLIVKHARSNTCVPAKPQVAEKSIAANLQRRWKKTRSGIKPTKRSIENDRKLTNTYSAR